MGKEPNPKSKGGGNGDVADPNSNVIAFRLDADDQAWLTRVSEAFLDAQLADPKKSTLGKAAFKLLRRTIGDDDLNRSDVTKILELANSR